MKKKILKWTTLTSATLALLSYAPTVSAQMFQNGNTDCQQILVLTDNGGSNSVACQNINGAADFNGDAYPDCALLTSTTTDSAPTDVFSVLMNLATASTGCSSQFDAADNYTADGLEGLVIGSPLGSIVAGPILSSSAFDDAAAPSLDPAVGLGDTVYATLPSVASGGFGAVNPIATSNANYNTGNVLSPDVAFSNDTTDKNAALIDCNNDGFLDAAVVVRDNSALDVFKVNLLINNAGTGLQDAASFADTQILANPLATDIAALAVGDFNNDNNDDVVVVASSTALVPSASVVEVCTNDGSCGFTCQTTTQINLNTLHSGSDPLPTSIVAGDFNGDGNYDVAVNTPGLATASEGVDFLFGNGATVPAFPTNLVVAYIGGTTGEPSRLTTGCYDNDNTTDVSMSYSAGAGSNVGVFTNITNTDLNTDVLNFNPTNILDPIILPTGIDSADFDRLGGDDIITLALNPDGKVRVAYVFLNTVETIVANAGTDITLSGPGSAALTGTCAIDPEDESAVFANSWAILSPETGGTLSGGTTLTPTFTATAPGTYTIELTCRTRCDGTGTDTVVVTVGGTLPPGITTQGGCVGNTLSPSAPSLVSTLYGFVLFAPVMVFGYRRRRFSKSSGKSLKNFLFFAVILAGVGASFSAQALTQSFSTQMFRPTVDDSDYLSVYSSQTLQKNNYHFGLWLDYAKDPYEVGNTNYNRVSGITNSLVTGNFLGTYGVMDWFNVGGRLPVYFINNIDATILGRISETRIDLGDFELDLKFKLLDREKKHIGLSIVPFITFPTATRAASDFTGNGNFTGGALLAVDGKVQERVTLALNTGFQGRGSLTEIGGNTIGSKFLISGAVAVDIIKKQLKVIGETQVETVVSNFFDRHTTPAEARLGIRYRFKNGINVNVAGGMGYTNGIGSPELRAIAGVTYTTGRMNEFTLKEPAPDTFELKDEDVWAKANVGDELKLRDKIYFDYDKASIRPISKPTLDKLALFLKNHPEFTKLRIEGNTCDLGSEKYNMGLSKRRAMSVNQYLVSQGVNPSRLEDVGNGESKPLVPNSDEAHREQNRRVQIFVAAKQ